ncbi:MAG: hypothetical protein ACO1OX_11970 [Novosphingobium sp.]
MQSRNCRTAAWGALAAAILPFATPLAAQSTNGVGSPFELAFWQSVAGSEDPAVYEAYLQQYPAGTFAGLAKAKVASLRKAVPQPATAAPSAAPAPQPASAPAVTPAGPAASLAAAAPAPAALAASDAALLTELAKSQEAGAGTAGVATAQGFALPVRPALADVSDLPLPGSFCSAEQRNAFYELRYKPLLEVARGNNAVAIAHMQKLQQAYDGYQLSRDPTPMNVLAAEARDYQQQVAAMTYSRQAAVVRQFDAIMAVPIAACPVTVASK